MPQRTWLTKLEKEKLGNRREREGQRGCTSPNTGQVSKSQVEAAQWQAINLPFGFGESNDKARVDAVAAVGKSRVGKGNKVW